MPQPHIDNLEPSRVRISATCVLIVIRGKDLDNCVILFDGPTSGSTTFIDSGTLVLLLNTVEGPVGKTQIYAHNTESGDISNKYPFEIYA